jgi:hypothetical protein
MVLLFFGEESVEKKAASNADNAMTSLLTTIE